MALPFPEINPVILQLGPLAIRWYSLAYIAGIIGGFLIVKKELAARPLANLSKSRIDDMIIWAIIGIMLGGRLGYTLFYQTEYYLNNPLKILYIWEGGMSFHGGFIGFALAFLFFCRKYKIPYLPLMDLMACVAPIGIGLGRIANFINGELFGRISNVSWAVIFPNAGDLPRHPSQIYEALLEGLLLFALMMFLLKKTNLRKFPGALCAAFLIFYALARICCEFFREPDIQLGFIYHGATMGQLLSLPMLALGIFLWMKRQKANVP